MVCTLTCVRILKEVVKRHVVQLPQNVMFWIQFFQNQMRLHKVHFHMHFKLLSWIVLFIIDPFVTTKKTWDKTIYEVGVIKLQGDLLPLSSGR